MSQIFRSLPNDEYQAAINANSPSAANPFLTAADLPLSIGGLYSQTDSSIAVTFGTGPGSLIGAGVGALSLPPNTFVVGDSFHVNMACYITSANNQDLEIAVLSNGNVLGTTGVMTMPAITGGSLEFEIDFTIRKIGTATNAEIVSAGFLSYIKDSSSAYEGETFITFNNTTFDTTVLNTLEIKATWTGSDPSNTIYSQLFTLSKVY